MCFGTYLFLFLFTLHGIGLFSPSQVPEERPSTCNLKISSTFFFSLPHRIYSFGGTYATVYLVIWSAFYLKKKHFLLGHPSVNVFPVFRFNLNSLHGFGCLVCQLTSVKIFGAKKNIFSTYCLCSFALALWIFFRHPSCNSSFTG